MASTLLFVSTFSSRAGLGDTPESVAGVRSLGILHAPGYVTYVVAARLFGEVFRFGGWEFRVNLFSLVCAVLSVAAVYLLARCFGANKAGAAIGALALATTSSFWFNADFAKYYSFTALLLTVMALCVLAWLRTGRGALLVGAGVLLGSSLGASWQLAVIMAAGLACIIGLRRPRPGLGILLVAGGAALFTAIAVCVFIVVRAGQDPTVNFGNATGLSRLFELLTTADFSGARGAAGAAAGTDSGAIGVNLAIIGRHIGLGAIALACVGTFDLYVRRRLGYALFFGVVALGNVVAVSLVGGKVVIAGMASRPDRGRAEARGDIIGL